VTKPSSRGFRSTRCPKCLLPQPHCLCAQARSTPAPLSLILLRHPKEAWRSSGTGALLLRCFEGAELVEPSQWDARQALGFEEPVAILFPPDGEDCLRNPQSPDVAPQIIPRTLIVPDGSWMEARRMVRKNDYLRTLPRVSPCMATRWIADPLRVDIWERPCTAEAVGQYFADLGWNEPAAMLREQLFQFVAAHRKARGLPPPLT